MNNDYLYEDFIEQVKSSLNAGGSGGSSCSCPELLGEDGLIKSELLPENELLDSSNKIKSEYIPENYLTVGDTAPNPNALVINGQTYDGSARVDVTSIINGLIDTKLGVIENGAY